MQCERLIKLIKTWYLSVRDETMAPARMISFIEHHAASCETCAADSGLREEIIKITEIILPESKIPKAVRQQNADDEDEGEDEEYEEISEDYEEEEVDSDDDDEEEELPLEDDEEEED